MSSRDQSHRKQKPPDWTKKKSRYNNEQLVYPVITCSDLQIFEYLKKKISKIEKQLQAQAESQCAQEALLTEITRLLQMSLKGNVSLDKSYLLNISNVGNVQITHSGQNSISISPLDQDENEDPSSNGRKKTRNETCNCMLESPEPEQILTAAAVEETYLQESCTDSTKPILQLTDNGQPLAVATEYDSGVDLSDIDSIASLSDTESESDGEVDDVSVLGDTVSVDATDIDQIDDGGKVATSDSTRSLLYSMDAGVSGQFGFYQSSYADADTKFRMAVPESPESQIVLFSLAERLKRLQKPRAVFSDSWKFDFQLSSRGFSIYRPRSFFISDSVGRLRYLPMLGLDNQEGVLPNSIMPSHFPADRSVTESKGEELQDACTDHPSWERKAGKDGRQMGLKKRKAFDSRDGLSPLEKGDGDSSKEGKEQTVSGTQYGAQRMTIFKAAAPDSGKYRDRESEVPYLLDPEQAKQTEPQFIKFSEDGSLKPLNCRPDAGHAEFAMSQFVTGKKRPHISSLGICLPSVRPELAYGLGPQQSLEKLQNQALRLITGARRTDPIGTKENVTAIQPFGRRWQGKTLVHLEKFRNLPKHPIKRRRENLARCRLKGCNFVHYSQKLQQKHIQNMPKKTLPLPRTLDQIAMLKPWENSLCRQPVISTTVQCIIPQNIQMNSRGRLLSLAMIRGQYPERSWIHVYTGMNTARSAVNAVRKRGAGVFIKFPSGVTETASMAAGTHHSIHAVEVQALKMAATLISDTSSSCEQVVFFTDTLSVLQALKENNETELLGMLQGLCQTRRVFLQWVPGHCGIPGNRSADEQAKEGFQSE